MNAPFNPPRTGTRDPFVAFVCDEQTADVLRSLSLEFGWSAEKVNKGGLRNAVQSLSVSASPTILVVDLSESGDPLTDINALAEVCEPGTIVIALGQVNDVRLYRDLIASGIQDYLLKPINIDAMRDSLSHAQAMLTAPKHAEPAVARPHANIAVIGTRGGAGASTITTSLGWMLSERLGRNTALLDLDVHFGTDALILDLEPGRGLTDAIENPSRIDGLFIERAMVRSNERLAVLSAEAPLQSPIVTDGSAFYQLEEELRSAFECTIVDMPRIMMMMHSNLLTETQVAVIVTELTLASARDTIRILSWFKQTIPHAQVLIVANRVQPVAQQELSRKDFESSIERKIDFAIPYDGRLAAQAAKLGKTLAEVARSSKAMAGFGQLAHRVAELTSPAEDNVEIAAPRGRGSTTERTHHESSLLGKLIAARKN